MRGGLGGFAILLKIAFLIGIDNIIRQHGRRVRMSGGDGHGNDVGVFLVADGDVVNFPSALRCSGESLLSAVSLRVGLCSTATWVAMERALVNPCRSSKI